MELDKKQKSTLTRITNAKSPLSFNGSRLCVITVNLLIRLGLVITRLDQDQILRVHTTLEGHRWIHENVTYA